MRKIVQVRVYKGEKYYVAECIDLPVVTQGETLDKTVENIKEAIELHLEDEDLTELDLT
ncbi:MAG: type II toxin-antitoxin system HicB family antitoxin [Archaeoglobaceae archaeon]